MTDLTRWLSRKGISLIFSHPLARKAKVWTSGTSSAPVRGTLVVVTTLELDPSAKKYKADKVTALSNAATEWLSFHQNVANDFVLMNRTKDW